jgi:oligopeptide/dipeptide ABC transporter ATP-binding protein
VPDLIDLPEGCAFKPRCTWSKDHCREWPEWREMSEGHFVRCLLYQ